MNARLTVTGTQGHAPIRPRRTIQSRRLAELVARLAAWTLDDGTGALRSVDTGLHHGRCRQSRDQCDPGARRAPGFNIRFNDRHKSAELVAHIERRRGGGEGRGVADRGQRACERRAVPHEARTVHDLLATCGRGDGIGARRCRRQAARRTRASSRIIARSSRWACRAARCTRRTNACRWLRSRSWRHSTSAYSKRISPIRLADVLSVLCGHQRHKDTKAVG